MQTQLLTHTDINTVIPELVKILLKFSKERYLSSYELIDLLKHHLGDRINYDISPPLFRRLINYIRRHCLLGIISNSRGYKVSYDLSELSKTWVSLRTRAASINAAADGIKDLMTRIQEAEGLDFI
jgi:hypothetical protein